MDRALRHDCHVNCIGCAVCQEIFGVELDDFIKTVGLFDPNPQGENVASDRLQLNYSARGGDTAVNFGEKRVDHAVGQALFFEDYGGAHFGQTGVCPLHHMNLNDDV